MISSLHGIQTVFIQTNLSNPVVVDPGSGHTGDFKTRNYFTLLSRGLALRGSATTGLHLFPCTCRPILRHTTKKKISQIVQRKTQALAHLYVCHWHYGEGNQATSGRRITKLS